jgi:hypothetical protein
MLKTGSSLFLLLALACASGCATTVHSREYPALRERKVPITRVAIAPFQATGSLAQAPDPRGGVTASLATALVARYISEALASRGVAVVPPDDVARALAIETPPPQGQLAPRVVAQVVAKQFGADAVLLGQVNRFDERRGQAAGTLHPAAVGFEVTLYAAPGSQRLWNGAFHETQQALSENVFSTLRYPGGGMRWLTAEELAKWGATETVASIPIQ